MAVDIEDPTTWQALTAWAVTDAGEFQLLPDGPAIRGQMRMVGASDWTTWLRRCEVRQSTGEPLVMDETSQPVVAGQEVEFILNGWLLLQALQSLDVDASVN